MDKGGKRLTVVYDEQKEGECGRADASILLDERSSGTFGTVDSHRRTTQARSISVWRARWDIKFKLFRAN